MNEPSLPSVSARGTLTACVLTALVVLAGCSCDQRGRTCVDDRVQRLKKQGPCGEEQPDRPYRLGSCAVQQDVRDLMGRVPGATPLEWNRIARKLVGYREAAVPQLVANLGSSELSVQLMSAYVLGIIEDPRSLDALYAATLDAGKPKLRYEAATAMLRMGDQRGLSPMIDALEAADPLVRARAILVLKERTGETFGYKADDRPDDRAAAVARWRAWLEQKSG